MSSSISTTLRKSSRISSKVAVLYKEKKIPAKKA